MKTHITAATCHTAGAVAPYDDVRLERVAGTVGGVGLRAGVRAVRVDGDSSSINLSGTDEGGRGRHVGDDGSVLHCDFLGFPSCRGEV